MDLARFLVRGVDSTPDPRSGGWLVVGAQGQILGMCVGPNGQPAGPLMTIKPGSASFGAFPRARYARAVNGGNGGFLVVWSEEQPDHYIVLKSRIVTCDGPIGAEQVVSDAYTAWLEPGNLALNYSRTSQQFLAVWKTHPAWPPVRVVARLIDINGTGVGAAVPISAGFGRDPGVTWNANTNEFGISFSGESGSTAFSVFVKAPASNLAAFTRTTFNTIGGGLTTATDIDYNPLTNRYVMGWFQFSSAGLFSVVAQLDWAGNVLSVAPVSGRLGSYDAFSMGFNPATATFLMAGLDRANDAVIGLHLDGTGARLGDEVGLSSSAPPARYPRLSSSAVGKAWNIVWASDTFRALTNQVAVPIGGVVQPAPAPPPPPTSSVPMLSVDTPGPGATVAGAFMVGGWAIDQGAPYGAGVDAVHVYAYPVGGGAPTFLGAANLGVPRPDVAAALGARYATAGFQLTTLIAAAGQYDIAVHARSSLTGTFNNLKVVRVNVLPPPSLPRMWVDTPAQNDNLSQNVSISGWALDLASSAGPGIDAIHVWAYPLAGGAPFFVAVGSYGSARGDVAAAFGSARFTNTGFKVSASMPRGQYDLVVFARSSVAGAFNQWFVIRVNIL